MPVAFGTAAPDRRSTGPVTGAPHGEVVPELGPERSLGDKPGLSHRHTGPRVQRPSHRVLVAGAVLASLALAGGGVALVSGLGTDRPVAQGTPVDPQTPRPAQPSPTRPTAVAGPAEELQDQLDADAATVETLVDRWVPQLSSKREGDVVAGVYYDAAAVLSDFRAWQQRVPGSVLTRSDRFTSFRSRDFWVTLAAEPFDSAESANQWCSSQGLPPNDCFAKRLSHTEGPSGNTRTR